jgi:hypothetical protein
METHLSKTVQLAREAGIDAWWDSGSDWRETFNEHLKAFEALVRADGRKAAQAEHEADKVIIEYHEATIKRLEAAILAEREACAKVCEEYADDVRTGVTCAKAIRARGQI